MNDLGNLRAGEPLLQRRQRGRDIAGKRAAPFKLR